MLHRSLAGEAGAQRRVRGLRLERGQDLNPLPRHIIAYLWWRQRHAGIIVEDRMTIRRRIGFFVLAGALALPVAATAQSVNVTRSILEDQPYTLIYPDTMLASGSAGE